MRPVIHLDDARLLLSIAEHGSISAAARRADLTPAAASATLKRLEAVLRVRLFERSTRSLRLTPEGELMRDTCERLLAAWSEGEALIGAQHRELTGTLRVAVPSDLARVWAAGWAADFGRLHPSLQVVLHLSDSVRELIREPADVALRYGELPDSGQLARRLCDNGTLLVASPDYLARRGTPRTPQDLVAHDALTYFLRGRPYTRWKFQRAGREVEVTVRSPLSADDGHVVREWAVQGRGVAVKSRLDVWPDLRAGRLVPLLPGWHTPEYPLHAVFPSPRHVPLRARRYVDFVAERIAAEGLDGPLPGPALEAPVRRPAPRRGG